jgi:hypothetical protein
MAQETLATGNSTVVRSGVNIALHVPSDLDGPHGPAGIFIWFGGVGDSISYYQKAFTPLADTADMVVVVPQMPWFADHGQVQSPGVYQALEGLVAEIEKRFQTDPQWIMIGGASAGGPPANELAKKWSPRVARLVLASTNLSTGLEQVRTLHVVAEHESPALRLQGAETMSLGQGKKDSFAVPKGEHSAQVPHVELWLATEVAAMRLEQGMKTMRLTEEPLTRNDIAQAKAILKSTFASAHTLSEPAPNQDAFFQYETRHRQELLKSFAPTVEALNNLHTKLFPPSPETTSPSPVK